MNFKTRPCKVKGKKALFHRWSDKRKIISPSVAIGGHNGGTSQYTVGIVEYVEDGTIHECYPDEIRFLDSKQKSLEVFWEKNQKEV